MSGVPAALLAGLVALLGTAAAAQPTQPGLVALLDARGQITSAWRPVGLPQQRMPATRFDAMQLEGQAVLRIEAVDSYGTLVHDLAAGSVAQRLQWRWRVDEPNPRADLRSKDGDDSAVKVCALYDLPIAAVPFWERQKLRLARLLSGEALPAASVCYVWDAGLEVGTAVVNPYTARVRTLVVRGQGSAQGKWTSELRDLRADFLRLFGDESAEVPRLAAIAIGADADNTHARSLAYLIDLRLE